jgi:hypothetical protein
MYRYIYSLNGGRAYNIRYAPEGYVLQPGELEGEGFPLPSVDDLSVTMQAQPYSTTLDMGGDINQIIGR